MNTDEYSIPYGAESLPHGDEHLTCYCDERLPYGD